MSIVIKAGGAAHRLLDCILKGANGYELERYLWTQSRNQNQSFNNWTKNILIPLAELEHITRHGEHIRLTQQGTELYYELEGRNPIKRAPVKRRITEGRVEWEEYKGEEYVSVRPDSLDFLQYPSRSGNRLFYRDGRTEDYAPQGSE